TAAAVAPANVSISTGSGVVPTASTTISTATSVTSYTRRKGKEKMKRDFYMAVIRNNLGEAAWLKKKGIRSEQESAKKQKTSEEVPEEVKSSDEMEHQVKGRIVGNKMHKAFPLPVTEFPLLEELPTTREDSCHCQKKREATAREDRTAINVKKKLRVKGGTYAKLVPHVPPCIIGITETVTSCTRTPCTIKGVL
nr:hypothetical protein [Tanacetum cinerariifolium]